MGLNKYEYDFLRRYKSMGMAFCLGIKRYRYGFLHGNKMYGYGFLHGHKKFGYGLLHVYKSMGMACYMCIKVWVWLVTCV